MTQKKRAWWMIYGLRLSRPVFHAWFLAVIFRLAYIFRQRTDWIPWIQLDIPFINIWDLVIFATISIIVFVIMEFSSNAYNLSQPLHWYYPRFFKWWSLWVISMTFLALFGGGFLFGQWISRFIILFVAIGGLIVLSLFDLFWNSLNSRVEMRNPYRVLALYDDEVLLKQFVEEFEDYPIYDIRAITFEEYDSTRRWDNLDIVIVLWTHDQNVLQTIADHARINGKSLYHVPESYFLEDLVSTSTRLWPIVALEHKPSPLDGWFRVWKRLFDFVGATFAIVVLSPVFVLIAIAILIESRGPVFFVQKRIGRKWKEFSFVKFRSMYTQFSTWEGYGGIDADRLYRKLIRKRNRRDDILPKIENDPRVTKVWRFLRKSSLDELPNIFCIWMGTMSFVWPRPHLPNEVDKYEPWMRRLFAIKPGMTGYAQIFWRDSLPFREEATLDLYYIQNRSIGMDLHVLLSTMKVIFAWR
jgi:lipopolysaccharide/colanic/teichoic acid biosynthesis glycosyltransferase